MDNDALEALGLTAADLPETWRTARVSPADRAGARRFLSGEFLWDANALLALPPDHLTALMAAAGRMAQSRSLMELFALARQAVFPPGGGEPPIGFPDLTGSLGDERDLFPALTLLSELPALRRRYRELGIGDDILAATLGDMAIWMADFLDLTGRYGLGEYRWLIHHFRARIFRLGRLQFMAAPFAGDVRAYRHRDTGAVVALSEPGVVFRADGQVGGTNGIPAGEGGWTAPWSQADGVIEGTPLSPRGYALPRTLALPAQAWEPILQKGDGILEVHIPAGERLSPQACRASFQAALPFWRRHFPGTPVRAFTCASWLLDPQFGDILPPESNLALFQRPFYLYPIRGGDEQTFWRVFRCCPGEATPAMAVSSLQRAILDHVSRGGRLHDGAMFLPAEDLDRWDEPRFSEDFDKIMRDDIPK